MEKRIVLMTANTQGGIVQFTFQLYRTLKALGYSVKVCFPAQLREADLDEILPEDRLQYQKKKSVISKKPYQEIANQIMETAPHYVWYCDDSVVCAQVGICIKNKNTKQLLTLHDAAGYHPTNHESMRNKMLRQYIRWLNGRFYKRVYRFVLLSPECEKLFHSRFPACSTRVVRMNLGAHIPKDAEIVPEELTKTERTPYLLFFGRIDKYKGIGNLLQAYNAAADKSLPLVIAGSGALTDTEKHLMSEAKNVTLINRYIHDGEMKWLFAHATAIVLPYIEATQSGVIPIAYAYGKPVIVSNVPGLTQFVREGKTGMVADNISSLSQIITELTEDRAAAMKTAVVQYHEQHMNWERNLLKMFTEV